MRGFFSLGCGALLGPAPYRNCRDRTRLAHRIAGGRSLRSDQAESLFTRFGPSSIELDLLMAAKRRAPVLPDRIAE
ncbi:hypothetical protein [Rhizobium lentis]|uniref:hypothetical protein n=1 Tax=Rhizobium lentis TaxID=1138194 RepID=UPI0038621B3A